MEREVITLKSVISESQLMATDPDLKNSLYDQFNKAPRVYETDGKEAVKVQAVYSNPKAIVAITEFDLSNEQLQAYGWVMIDGDYQNAEFGYIPLSEYKNHMIFHSGISFKGIEFNDFKKEVLEEVLGTDC